MLRLFLVSLLFAAPPRAQTVVAIGGGERTPEIMAEIVRLAGGREARLVVVPLASSDPSAVGAAQAAEFTSAGAATVDVMRDSADVGALGCATAVFFSGGDQNRLARALLGTEALRLVGAVLARGGVVAGTSAGAAVMSRTMITGEICDGPSPVAPGCVETADGFGFLDALLKTEVVVDQHFANRDRHGRLLAAVLDGPARLGIGIDEATALVVSDSFARVVGRGNVTVITTTADSVEERDDVFSAHRVTLRLFIDGDTISFGRYAAP